MRGAELTAAAIDKLDHVRRFVPVRYLPTLIDRRISRAWENEDFRHAQEKEMRFLLEHTERADEIPELARKFAEQSMRRAYLRWHPGQLVHQRVKGVEWLTTRRDPERGVILNFMHHAQYDGLFGSLDKVGVRCHVVVSPLVLGGGIATAFKQHVRVVAMGAEVVPAEGGRPAMEALLGPGVTLAIASDVPGQTEVTFLGRRVRASFGAALIAANTNTPVVLATFRRDDEGSYIQIEEPLEPSDFDSPKALLDEIFRRHEPAVLDWPEALLFPTGRWGIIEE